MTDRNNSKKDLIDIIEISFEDVNNKVHGLLDCSVKDFVVLNDNFQKQYKLLETLSSSTNTFLNNLLDISEVDNIKTLCIQSKKDINTIGDNLNNSLSSLKTLYNKYHFASLSITNLRQDLITLKLLYTNLKFEPGLKYNQEQIQNCFSMLEPCLSQYDVIFSNIIRVVSELTNLLENSLGNSLDAINNFIENVSNLTNNISIIQNDSQKQASSLSEITSEKNSNTSVIITNLQFQDILRQKVEHIQSAHELITKKLFENHSDKNELTPKQLSQIRDISSLQSAQLVHANNEYQNAVETILKKFSNLTQIAQKFNGIWNHYCKPESQKINSKNDKLKSFLNDLEKQLQLLESVKKDFSKLEDSLINQFKLTSDKQLLAKCDCKVINDLESHFETAKEKVNSKSFSATDQFKHELAKFKKGHSKFILIVEDLSSYQISYQSSLLENIKHAEKISEQLSKEILSLVNRLSLFETIPAPSINVTDITLGIDKVSYYKAFEKEVKEIINIHNSILKMINVEEIDPNEDNLEELRNMYTMQSERNIHNTHTHQSNENNTDENDDNEVEFF